MRGIRKALFWSVLVAGILFAKDATVATWNVGLREGTPDVLQLGEIKATINPDVMVLNEVRTLAHVKAIVSKMGFPANNHAISSFGNGDHNLEVAIISKYPLSEVKEFDPYPEAQQSVPTQFALENPNIAGVKKVGTARGYLVAKIESLNYYIIATHLKSSQGRTGKYDLKNSQKREYIAASMAKYVSALKASNPKATIFVMGDFNVGVTDRTKNGSDLSKDYYTGSYDRYDETHFLLKSGVVQGLKMKGLSDDLGSTFVGSDGKPDYPHAGAIDVIYVTGGCESKFGKAKNTTKAYGSDHLMVYASSKNCGVENQIRIIGLLPNPDGADARNETITLENMGEKQVVSGWYFQDASGKKYVFPPNTEVKQGVNVILLAKNTMPLNNTGDSVTLFNENGEAITDAFVYEKSQVISGKEITLISN